VINVACRTGAIGATLALLVVRSEQIAAQTTLVVTAADAQSKDFLAGVEIRIVDLRRSASTDEFGEVRINGLSAGRHRIDAHFVGYQPEAVDLPFRSGDTLRVTFLMKRIPTALDTTRITAARVPSRLSEFEARRAMGIGRFLTEPELEAEADRNLGRVVAQRFPGLVAVDGITGRGTYLFSTRGARLVNGRCAIQVYVDGVRLGAPQEAADLTEFKPQSLAGVEFHNETTIPAEYRSGNVCGVLLLWTK